ncbi:hypothetical protein KCU71_g4168, partial [Aureobasidium melanogenum]
MSVAQYLDTDDDGPATKKSKTGTEDDFPYGTRIVILRSYGKAICHVPAGEFNKISTMILDTSYLFFGTTVQVYDFDVEEPLIRFLAHWIHHRNSEEAVVATMNRQTERSGRDLDEEWLVFLIRAMNCFDDPTKFTCDLTDSLIDDFLRFLRCGGLAKIDQVFKICKSRCKTQVLTSIFANVFIYHNKRFAKQAPTCDYERAVQKYMHEWLADVLINDGDWNKLPPEFRGSNPKRRFDECFHHGHGKEKDCYVCGRIIHPG